MRGACGCDDDIGAVAGLVKLVKRKRLAIELLGERDRTIIGAVGDKDGSGSVGEQMPRCQFTHLACAYQVDMLALQGTKYFLGEFDGYGSN